MSDLDKQMHQFPPELRSLQQRIGRLPYQAALSILTSRIVKLHPGLAIWARNSFLTDAFRPLRSDLDLTIWLERSPPDYVLEQLQNILLRTKRYFPALGERNVYAADSVGRFAKFANRYELARDPLTVDRVKKFRGTLISERAEASVYLLRMLEANWQDLALRKSGQTSKWHFHLHAVGMAELSNDEWVNPIMAIVTRALAWLEEIEGAAFCSDVINNIYNYFRGRSEKWPGQVSQTVAAVFPHHFCYVGFPSAALKSALSEIFAAQISWEIWGLYGQCTLGERKTLPAHLERLLRWIDCCEVSEIGEALKQGLKDFLEVLENRSPPKLEGTPQLCMDVIIATKYRADWLERSVQSIVDASRADERFKIRVLVCASGGDEQALERLRYLSARNKSVEIKWLSFKESLSPAIARNRLLPLSAGDWLFFIDDDAFVEEDFFSKFLALASANPHAAVIGGPNLTPPRSSLFQSACGAALTSRFGAASSRVRYASRFPRNSGCGEEALILCNLFIKREAMDRLYFRESLTSNEENWLLQDLSWRGHLMVYEPKLYVLHERRATVDQFVRQIHRYGRGRGQILRLRPQTLRLFHLLPALCVLFSFAAAVSLPWFPVLAKIWLVLFLGYGAVFSIATFRLRKIGENNLPVCLLGGLLFPLIHVTYGLGVLRGLSVAHE